VVDGATRDVDEVQFMFDEQRDDQCCATGVEVHSPLDTPGISNRSNIFDESKQVRFVIAHLA
jgi:hypothetical protein